MNGGIGFPNEGVRMFDSGVRGVDKHRSLFIPQNADVRCNLIVDSDLAKS